MPLYEYECFVCRNRFERIQKVTAEVVKECPSCGGSVRRLLGAPALQFKGSGWYVTDYGKGNGDSAARERLDSHKDTSSNSSASDAKPDSAPAEKKPAAKESSKNTASTG